MTDTENTELRICFLTDGKPGHQNQSLGLIEAIRRRFAGEVRVEEFAVPAGRTGRIRGAWWVPEGLNPPDIVIGAGHATHLPMLSIRRRVGGKTVVLMKPSLPIAWFDLCVVPDVDEVPEGRTNVVRTRGVMNRIVAPPSRTAGHTMMLLGGPSNHFEWNDDEVIDQISRVLSHASEQDVSIVTSRRTPDALVPRIMTLCADPLNDRARIIEHHQVDRDWLPNHMGQSDAIWVTQDSVSMTYEAVTSGACVGVLELPRRRVSRVTENLDRLIQSGDVTPFSVWVESLTLTPPTVPLCEADRVSEEVLRRFQRSATSVSMKSWAT